MTAWERVAAGHRASAKAARRDGHLEAAREHDRLVELAMDRAGLIENEGGGLRMPADDPEMARWTWGRL